MDIRQELYNCVSFFISIWSYWPCLKEFIAVMVHPGRAWEFPVRKRLEGFPLRRAVWPSRPDESLLSDTFSQLPFTPAASKGDHPDGLSGLDCKIRSSSFQFFGAKWSFQAKKAGSRAQPSSAQLRTRRRVILPQRWAPGERLRTFSPLNTVKPGLKFC